ncbi:putative C6 finger domain protein [Aspergillus undulatus]|uniref:putative C6 finger domain protein n=1 Tax=Aspergillus undulatus TaxID=1810928 RepID=UPI003CCD351F
MISAFEKPPTEDLRLPKVPARNLGAPTMEAGTPDDRSRAYPQYSGPSPPMHRIPPHSEVSHGLPGAPGVYDQSWRQYPPPFEHPHAETRRVSSVPQPPIPSHTYPPMQNRELPHIPTTTESPYGRTPSIPTSIPTSTGPLGPVEAPPPNFHPMSNGAPHETSPLSAGPDYSGRPRMSYGPPDQPSLTNGNPPVAANEYPTTVPPTVSHTPVPYDAGYYQSQSYNNMRHRKATRAQQACDQCRARKAKCDEGRPACSHCKENQLICVYKEVPPHKQEKNTQAIIDRTQTLEDNLDGKFESLHRLHLGHDQTLDQILLLVKEMYHRHGSETQTQSQYPGIKSDDPEPSQMSDSKGGVALAADGVNPSDQDVDVYAKTLLQTGEDGELSIPVEHTTAAHKLLKWPAITKLLEGYDDDYVMKIEQSRGAVSFSGRGEAQEPDDINDTYVPHPWANAVWNANIKYNQAPPEIRGIDGYGMLSIDGATVRRYYESYVAHIHKLHPFLKLENIELKLDRFIAMHCPKPGLQTRNSMEIPRSAKRKRSGEMLQAQGYDQRSPTEGSTDSAPPQEVQKTIGNAIILLILALGRICEVRDEPIRGPCTDRIIDYRNEPIPGVSTTAGPSPANPDSMLPPHNGVTSPFQSHLADARSHSASAPWPTNEKFLTFPDPPELQNEDTVPGLAYYRYAAGILNENYGVTTLPYVQAALLAGLYTGQLAHPFKSYAWINQAAIACQVLVRPKSYAELGDGEKKDIVKFAFWTCLQLESDILAELDLPASGISRSESRISLPKGRIIHSLPNEISSPNTLMMFHYSAQTHLRKILNRVHTDLYKVARQGQTDWSPSVQETLHMNLELWRTALPVEMRWSDHDPPSSDINVARMRAKFYGARYIIHRPLLHAALHDYIQESSAQKMTGNSPADFGSLPQQASPSLAHDQHAPKMARAPSEVSNSPGANGAYRSYRDLPPKIRRACKLCVQSAISSTTAFDGIVGRPVVTNIFGTAHAQFGNMLVLSAVHMSHLSKLISRSQLEQLLRRTIRFLLQYRNISPVLRIDARILTHIYLKIFGESPTA